MSDDGLRKRTGHSRLLVVGLSALIAAVGAVPSSGSLGPSGTGVRSMAPPLPPFYFTPLGKVLGPTDFGVTPGFYAATADMSAAVLPDGRVRLYLFVNPGQRGQGSIRSAISPDGIHFTPEPGIRVCDNTGQCGQTRVVPLDGGGWRLFFTAPNGIGSATSADGLNFVRDPGTRITNAQAGLKMMTVGSVVRLSGGGYRMYFSSSTAPGTGAFPPPDYILSATSPDLLNWTMDPGVRIGPGAPTLTGAASHPFALPNRDGTVTLLYQGQKFYPPTHLGFFYSTSRDGLAFSVEMVSDLAWDPAHQGTIPGDPDLIARPDGSYLMYYDQFDPATGTEIHVARVTSTLHARRVSLRLSRSRARGRVSVVDGYPPCRETVPIEIQRAAGKRWRTLKSLTTFDDGSYHAKLKASSGKFRVRAPRVRLVDLGHACRTATSPIRVLR